MTKNPIDAILTEAVIFKGKLVGTIEADSKDRYKDGETVVTSEITARYKNIFYTKNSIYYVVKLHKD